MNRTMINDQPHRRPISRRRWAVAFGLSSLLLAWTASTALAGPPSPGVDFHTLTLDGVVLGDDITYWSGVSLSPTIVFDAPTATYHMWVLTDDNVYTLNTIKHATSTDGLHFASTGLLSISNAPDVPSDPFTGLTPFGFNGGSNGPDTFFPKVFRSGSSYKLFSWTSHDGTVDGAIFGDYDYGSSVSGIGTNPYNLVVRHQGPIGPVLNNPVGPEAQSNGPWGLVNGKFYYENNGRLGRAGFAQSTLTSFVQTKWTGPWEVSISAAGPVKDIINTIPGYSYCDVTDGDPQVYPRNDSNVIDNGDGTLGLFFTLRDCSSGARVAKQIFYSESANDGVTWTDPVGIFADGNLVTVDGLANTLEFSGSFSMFINGIGATRVVYLNTADAGGRYVAVGSTPCGERFVATTGTDTNNFFCLDSNNPCATIQHAVNVAACDGDPIHVAPGTYNENVSVAKSVNLHGDGGAVTLLGAGGDGFSITAGTVDIRGFNIEGFANAIHLPTGSTAIVTAAYNRIVFNTVGVNQEAGSIDASSNWWGCNGGPNGVGALGNCDTTSGTVITSPYLKLHLNVDLDTINQCQTSTATADVSLDALSLPAPRSLAPSYIPDGVLALDPETAVVHFSQTPLDAIMSPADVALFQGTAVSILDPGCIPGLANVYAALDNEQVTTVQQPAVQIDGSAAWVISRVKLRANRPGSTSSRGTVKILGIVNDNDTAPNDLETSIMNNSIVVRAVDATGFSTGDIPITGCEQRSSSRFSCRAGDVSAVFALQKGFSRVYRVRIRASHLAAGLTGTSVPVDPVVGTFVQENQCRVDCITDDLPVPPNPVTRCKPGNGDPAPRNVTLTCQEKL